MPGDPIARMASVFEIDGRLLVQTVHSAGRAGLPERHLDVLDGYPDIAPDAVGRATMAALARCREVPWPASWPALREAAAPYLEHSPRRYRSFRSWQRAARYTGVRATAETVTVHRWLPDLGRGSWEPRPVGEPGDGWTYDVVIAGDCGPDDLGNAILTALQAPPLRTP